MPRKRKDYTTWTKKELIERIGALEKRKKYGLVWDEERTKEHFEKAAETSLPVLKEVKDKAINNDMESSPHILIEGDNFHALSVLNYTHEKAIDVIYIDPPYNTGARDWKYNNNFVDSNDPYRHSKWLSFMSKRLRLAKKLLKETGVLICTTDENEHTTLGLLLQELFASKEIVCVTIVHNPGGIQGNNFSYCHEYAYFIYPKGGTYITRVKRDDIPPTPLRDWGKETSKRESARNCFYPILVKDNSVVGFGDVCEESYHPEDANIKKQSGIIEVYPIDQKGIERKWRFSRQNVEGIRDELICREIKGKIVILRDKRNYRWKTVWSDPKYNANVYGTQLLNKIIEPEFPFPKSLYAVKDCISACVHPKDGIILDFFAGSGTTGHAVLELNKEDGGNRQFILCTNNENNICTEVCYPRIQKVTEGYKTPKGKQVAGLGGNLKYYRTNFVPAKPTDRNKELLTKQSTEMLCLRENTFEKVTETKTWKIFKNNHRYTGILFDQLKIPDFKKALTKLDKPVSVYVFSLEDDDFAEEFSDMKDKVKVCSIPEAILRVYRRIFK